MPIPKCFVSISMQKVDMIVLSMQSLTINNCLRIIILFSVSRVGLAQIKEEMK